MSCYIRDWVSFEVWYHSMFVPIRGSVSLEVQSHQRSGNQRFGPIRGSGIIDLVRFGFQSNLSFGLNKDSGIRGLVRLVGSGIRY